MSAASDTSESVTWRVPAATIGEMERRGICVTAATGVLELERIFLGDPTLSSVVVVDPQGEPACFARAGFFAMLNGRLGYGRALYTRQALWQLPPPPTLRLPASTTIVDAAGHVLRRSAEERYEDFVVDSGDGGLSTMCVADLFAELAHTQAFQGLHDALTGLANRRLFLARLSEARRAGTGFAVLFIDLDGFKSINDGLGHEVGDAALVTVAERLRAFAGPGATVARLGGDEFGVLLPEVQGREDLESILALAISGLSTPLRTGEIRTSLGASIGVAFGHDGSTPQELLRAADIAMYAAKNGEPGGWVFYEPRMRASAQRDMELRSALEHVLERDELFLVAQPIVDLDRGELVAAEVLLRWRHPDGIVSPADFIPLGEQTGMIIPIGRWVLREACRHAAGWMDARGGRPLRVSVNISPRQLGDPTIVEDVAAAVSDAGLPAWALTLEVTEGVFIHERDTDTVIGRLAALKDLGVRIALDDFGAGFSSLDRLAQMPIDVLKLDRAFAARLDSRAGRNLAAGIVALAGSLELATVGEGIETEAQARALQAMGCQLGQGFHFARPMAPGDLVAAGAVALRG